MNPIIQKFFVLTLLASFALVMTACNTMRGVGRDTSAVGKSIEREAERHIDDDEGVQSPSQPE